MVTKTNLSILVYREFEFVLKHLVKPWNGAHIFMQYQFSLEHQVCWLSDNFCLLVKLNIMLNKFNRDNKY